MDGVAPLGERGGDVEAEAEVAFVFGGFGAGVGVLVAEGDLQAFEAEDRAVVAFDHGFLAVPIAAAEVAQDDDAVGVFALHKNGLLLEEAV